MTRGEAWFTHASSFLVGGTGLAFGWMLYFAEPADDFAVVNHPWQPACHSLHILFAPLLVFACGIFWRDHVWKRVKEGFPPRRRSGLVLFALFGVMVASGYFVQTAVGEGWRLAWVRVQSDVVAPLFGLAAQRTHVFHWKWAD